MYSDHVLLRYTLVSASPLLPFPAPASLLSSYHIHIVFSYSTT